MAAGGFEVEGRQFRLRADYEAALRDKHKIDGIRSRVDLQNKKAILSLDESLKKGEYSFETLVGQDFEDEIYELVQAIEKGTFEEADTGKKRGAGQKKRAGRKAKSSQKGSASGKNGKELKPEDFDEEMAKQIRKELKKRELRRKLLVTFCALVAMGCFGYFGIYYYYIGRTENTYSEWAQIREKDKQEDHSRTDYKPVVVNRIREDGSTPEILDEYKTLYNKNKSLIGWIKIADTNIDYPVMQTANNEYYLDHNLNQEYDKNGSIFMDKDCDVLKPSTNLIVYGHHMKSGKMFGSLDKYSDPSYYEEHPLIEFDTIYEEGIYKIIYVFRSKIYTTDEIVFKYYQFIDANSEEEFYSNMNEMSSMSLYDTGQTAEYGDQLLTLSTCDYTQEDGRFVVVAKKIY